MASSLLGLAPGGGYLAIHITADAGGLLHHLFTITSRYRGAVCFCGPRPAGSLLTEASPPRVLSDAVLYGVRTFLDPDNAEPRSPNRPEAASSYTQGKGASTAAVAGIGCNDRQKNPPPQRSRYTPGKNKLKTQWSRPGPLLIFSSLRDRPRLRTTKTGVPIRKSRHTQWEFHFKWVR